MERRRSQLLALLAEGRSYADALSVTQYSYQGADKVIDAYNERGLDAVQDLRHQNQGAPTLLTDAELLWLGQAVRVEGEPWSGERVQQELAREFGKEVHLSRCYEFLDAVGYSQQQPRPRHVEADPIAQEEFKKRPSQRRSKQLQRVLLELTEP